MISRSTPIELRAGFLICGALERGHLTAFEDEPLLWVRQRLSAVVNFSGRRRRALHIRASSPSRRLYEPEAVVRIIEDNRPIDRCFVFSLIRVRLLFPQSQLAEDAFYHGGFVNQAYDLHVMAAAGATERVDFLDLFSMVRTLERKISSNSFKSF